MPTGFSEFSKILFLRPQYLAIFLTAWTGLIIGLILAIVIKRSRQPANARDSRLRLIGRDALWIATAILLVLAIIAVAGPYIPHTKTLRAASNVDVIIAFDKSASMAAQDIKPSRHDVAVQLISDFISGTALQAGDRLTLFTFGYQSSWRMPLSTDRSEFREQLSEVEHPKNRIYYDDSQLYTYLASALEHITPSLDKQDQFYKNLPLGIQYTWTPYQRVVVLITDGDDGSIQPAPDALKELKRRGIPVYAVGIGTESGTSTILRRTYLDEKTNKPVVFEEKFKTRLELKALRYIANSTNGKVYALDSEAHNGLAFLGNAIHANRKDVAVLVPSAKPEGFWWIILAIPAILILLYIVKVF